MSSSPCIFLPWDSDFWGFPVARVDSLVLRGDTSEKITKWCKENVIRCLYFAADGSDSETLQQAYHSGFKFVDVRVELECNAPLRAMLSSSDLEVRSVVEADLEALQSIARTAHYDTRFFKDLNFDRLRCENLYLKWIERDFTMGRILGYFPNNQPKAGGYITFSKETEDTARIGLLAVDESLRGCGGGGRLLDAAIASSAVMGLRKIRVATQGTNLAALKLYEKAGFRVCDVKIWFHRWFSPLE